MKIKSLISSHRGDTIVEVVLALTVIALVLGSASTLANRSTKSLQTTQEHAIALRVAQSQLEYLKNYIPTHTKELEQDSSPLNADAGYCMTLSNDIVEPKLADDAKCKVDETGGPTTAEPAYTIKIEKNTSSPGSAYSAKITVQWETLKGSTDKTELTYRTYAVLNPTKPITITGTQEEESTPPNSRPLQYTRKCTYSSFGFVFITYQLRNATCLPLENVLDTFTADGFVETPPGTDLEYLYPCSYINRYYYVSADDRSLCM